MKPSPASAPSAGLMQFADLLVGKLVLDAPCGSGRNTVALGRYGCKLIAADRDQRRLDAMAADVTREGLNFRQVKMMRCDLSERGWCFANEAFDAVVCVHFDFRPIFSQLLAAVRRGGYLYIETFGGQGRNYLELPSAGYVKEHLVDTFEIRSYSERKVGPQTVDAVTVRTFCRRCP
jgi:SAM-dependent methyltransferase